MATSIPIEVLQEVDLLDENQRAELAGICLATIDLSRPLLDILCDQLEHEDVGRIRHFLANRPRPAYNRKKAEKGLFPKEE